MRIPKYGLHKSTGQARVTINGKTYYLGKHNSDESRQEYARIVAEINATGRVAIKRYGTVAELVDAYLAWGTKEVLPRRSGRSSFDRYKRALAVVVKLYGSMPATDFMARELLTVRAEMAKKGWVRDEINRCIARIRGCWAWGVMHRMTTGESYSQLRTVPAFRGKIPGVKQAPPKYTPPYADIVAACDKMLPDLRAYCLALYWCGARPSELLNATAADLVEHQGIRVLRLSEHKTDADGHERIILIGPQCRAVLDPLIARRPTGPLFRRYDSDKRGRTKGNTGKAVKRACIKAGVRPWTLYSLRRAAITRWIEQFGDTQARRLAGHVAGGALAYYDQSGPDVEAARKAG